MADKFVRKNVVFNKESAWHMEILRRVDKESKNFSGYVMSILKAHFDIKQELPDQKENEQPVRATRIINNSSSSIKFKE